MKFSTIPMLVKRGILVVLEGNDRAGKSTQAKKLVESLTSNGHPSKYVSFPDRTTAIGSIINQYLTGKIQMDDHAIHLLFTANRWERYKEMLADLKAGTSLVVDRYSYSGVAYTASKENMSFEWCHNAEKGLLKPDCLLFLSCDQNNLNNREDFGKEVYETSAFQKSVSHYFSLMKDENWNVSESFFVEPTHLSFHRSSMLTNLLKKFTRML